MLYALDGIVFELAPLNVEGFERSTGSEYVEHPVVGVRPPLEPVGEGAEEMTLRGTVQAALFPDGVEALDKLRAASRDGKVRHLQRGDGENLGWWRITGLRESGSNLDSQGVARVSGFELTLKADYPPAASDYSGVS
jgi:hypothetical protein